MAIDNALKRYFDAGMEFTQVNQARAESIVKDLVKAGEVQTEQAQSTVNDLVERSRKNTERLLKQVRTEVRDQVTNLGFATKGDIARLERQIAALQKASAKKVAPKKAAAKKVAAKKAAPRKAAATQAAS